MGYVESSLGSSEKVIGRAYSHWISTVYQIVKWLLVSAVLVLVVYLIRLFKEGSDLSDQVAEYYQWAEWFIYFCLGVDFLLFVKYLIWSRTIEYAVTNKRVVMKSGFIRRKTFEIRIDKIESARVFQSILGRILRYGVLEIRGSGGSVGDWKIQYPMEFKKLIEEINSNNDSAGG